MKKFTFIIVLTFSLICNAQENSVFKKQKEINYRDRLEVQKIKSPFNTSYKQVLKPLKPNNILSTTDTLSYYMWGLGSSFAFFGQDWLMQCFQAPADLNIISLGLYCTENLNNVPVEVKIVKLNWSFESLLNAEVLRRGYYPAQGNAYNDITAFLDNPDRTGGWVSIQPDSSEPFGHDVWSSNGVGYSFVPDPTLDDYQWIDTDLLGNQPFITQCEIFGIALKNTSTRMDSDAVRFFAGSISNGPYMWKFYANGRLAPGEDYGWWTREYTFDFAVAVQIFYDGGGTPVFLDYSKLNSTLSTEPRPVFATVTLPGTPDPELIVSAILTYSTDYGTTWNQNIPIQLNHIVDSLYTGELPGFPNGTEVSYYFEASDTNSLCKAITPSNGYYVFDIPSANKTLVVLNGYNQTDGYPQDYFFGPDIQGGTSTFGHDTWAYGPLTADILNNYDNLIEICNGGPADYNDDVVRAWLEGAGNRNYYLEGQEWLGQKYGYADTTFVPGDFEFDILGINASFNDVSFDGTTGQSLPSKLIPQPGTLFGQPLIDRFNTYSPVPDSIQYNPIYEGNADNWIDGFAVESNVVVDVLTETRGINGVPNVQNLPCAIHRTLPNGNKIFFASYWTYAVNTATDNTMPTYHWLGFTNESPAYQALLWFGIPIITDVENTQNTLPTKFSLEQNYPNPFNPSTTIKYAISSKQLVQLKVYDILGNEIATIVNEVKPAGNYEIKFDSHSGSIRNLASGIYFYRLQVIDPESSSGQGFVETKKMLILK